MYIISIIIILYIMWILNSMHNVIKHNLKTRQEKIEYMTTKTVYICDGKKWHEIVGHYEMGPKDNRVVKKLPKPTMLGDMVEIHSIPWWSLFIR